MADEKEQDLDLGEEKKGGNKLILIIAAVAVLLIGGAAAAFFLLSGGDEPAAEDGEEVAEEIDKGPPTYIELTPKFVVNLPGKPSLLQAGISLRVYGDPMAEFIEHNNPMIRHHLLDTLAAVDAKALKQREAKEALQQQLLDELNRIIQEIDAPDVIDAVYFTSFVMQ